MLIYNDDILIYSRDPDKHIRHVKEVLMRLRQYTVFLKTEKSDFHLSSIQFLGYNVLERGVSMHEGKVDAITNWPTPNTIKDLQKFLGFANFYCRFIHNFSGIVSPFTSALKGKP